MKIPQLSFKDQPKFIFAVNADDLCERIIALKSADFLSQ